MKNILMQLDTDSHASSFDRVVAVDAGVDELFSYAGITPDNVEGLVHGAMFTRGPKDLKSTAIFVGGSRVADGEAVLERVKKTFFGPVRVSVMMDSNGSNTTAAAAVISAAKHVSLAESKVVVLGGTGPVGHRAAQILAMQGAKVIVVSRSEDRARQTCDHISSVIEGAELTAVGWSGADDGLAQFAGANVVIAAGAAGVELLSEEQRKSLDGLQVAIDLNAVPPLGLGGVGVMDKAKEINGVHCYGAIGVGGTKMKIHKAAVAKLFESNDQVLDTAAIYQIGVETVGA